MRAEEEIRRFLSRRDESVTRDLLPALAALELSAAEGIDATVTDELAAARQSADEAVSLCKRPPQMPRNVGIMVRRWHQSRS